MVHDPWFNILRTRLRQVPFDRRRRWTEKELREFAESVSQERAIVERELHLPPLDRIQEISRDLIGETADE